MPYSQAIKGIVVMSAELESMFNSFQNNQVGKFGDLNHRGDVFSPFRILVGSTLVAHLAMSTSLFPFLLALQLCVFQVPSNWSKVAYPSLKPLGSWIKVRLIFSHRSRQIDACTLPVNRSGITDLDWSDRSLECSYEQSLIIFAGCLTLIFILSS